MAIRKEVLHRRGALASPATRAPAAILDRPAREALDRVMKWSEAAGLGVRDSGFGKAGS
jgi:dihydrodipicolinate synthase/N-acetylneuraminate lyase